MITYETIGYLSFWGIGALAAVKLFKVLWNNFFGYYLGAGVKWEPGPDNWAVITGATDGIGLEYARQLAQKGYCVLLLSRTREKLERVAGEITKQFPQCTKVKTIAVDFTSTQIYEKIAAEIENIDGRIDVLVNNVGMGYKYSYFHEMDEKIIENVINCNMVSCTKMIKIILPKMVQNNRGIIINLSSIASSAPVPLMALYSASKIYIDYLSRALNEEYKTNGIIIQSVRPAYVSTPMTDHRELGFFTASPREYVESELTTVGIEGHTYGWWPHKLQALFTTIIETVVGCFVNEIVSKIMYSQLKIARDKRLDKEHKSN